MFWLIGALIDAKDVAGYAAITHAIVNERFAIATLLIERHADVHILDAANNTLLHHLALHPNRALIERLLEFGVPVDAKNAEGGRRQKSKNCTKRRSLKAYDPLRSHFAAIALQRPTRF